jgi:biopolymer transport protein ExbD
MRLELSPLAMVFFALAAVFLIGFAIAMNRRSLPIDLGGWYRDAAVAITVTGNDAFYWNQEGPIPIADFTAELSRRRPVHGYDGLSIGGDQRALHGNVMRIYDEARAAGEKEVGFYPRLREGPAAGH